MTKNANTNKIYVGVSVNINRDGKIIPKEIEWEDGSKYTIDKVMGVVPAASQKAGGQGDRYTIRIRNNITSLYFERSTNISGPIIGRWFVERK